jgi:hypothetical protein
MQGLANAAVDVVAFQHAGAANEQQAPVGVAEKVFQDARGVGHGWGAFETR